MKGLMGLCPLRIFRLEPPLSCSLTASLLIVSCSKRKFRADYLWMLTVLFAFWMPSNGRYRWLNDQAACVRQVLLITTTEIFASSLASSLPWLRRCWSSSASCIDVEDAPGSSESPPNSAGCQPTPSPRPPPTLSSTGGPTASRTARSKCATSVAPPTARRRTLPATPWRRRRGIPARRRRPAVLAAPVNDCSKRKRRRFLSYDADLTPGLFLPKTFLTTTVVYA